jgi:GR25 family glycosyltransferase involved in LPS biosynthesis
MSIKAFVITAAHEHSRKANVEKLQQQLPGLELAEAIYPKYQKIPFLAMLIAKSKERCGVPLSFGEIGVLLSNRKIWRKIVQVAESDREPFLILESDSFIADIELLKKEYMALAGSFDMFFWGAWTGHMKLKRSTEKKLAARYKTGEPFIKTVYGAYGYTVNKRAALHLLKQTGNISYAVDQYKRYIQPSDNIRIGGVVPDLILPGKGETESTIGHPQMHPFREKLWMLMLDIKNTVICFFK